MLRHPGARFGKRLHTLRRSPRTLVPPCTTPQPSIRCRRMEEPLEVLSLPEVRGPRMEVRIRKSFDIFGCTKPCRRTYISLLISGHQVRNMQKLCWLILLPQIRTLIDGLSGLQADPPPLYMDLEGVNLSRHGTISLITIYV